jgi:hypothetical protein
MPIRDDILNDRRFWAALYRSSFGQIGDSEETSPACSLLGVDEESTLSWWQEFTGWHPGIFGESEGHSDDPAAVRISLANGAELRVEFHPGDRWWFLRGPGGNQTMMANIGPHWALPGLRWQEAVALASAAPLPRWMPILLLLPIVWLTAGDDVQATRRAAESAWSASGLLSSLSATAMADLWTQAVGGGRDYRWYRAPEVGWVCDAHWSSRSEKRPKEEIILINRIITAATGPHNESLHATPR